MGLTGYHSPILLPENTRKVGFVKINSNCTLFDGKVHQERQLPGICFLRGNAVSIFVALLCDELADDSTVITKQYSLLVEQPRVPIGSVATLELPAGMIDDENESVAGIAVKEMEEECGIIVRPSDLIDLTELALEQAVHDGNLPIAALAPSGGGCDEFVRYMYLEKKVTVEELNEMKGKLSGLRDHGEFITLSVVPMEDVWRVSGDSKAIM
jgi:ADP-sugar diphosphatase